MAVVVLNMPKAQQTSGLGAFAKVTFSNFKLTPTCDQTILIYGLTEIGCCKAVAKRLSRQMSLSYRQRFP